MEESFTLNLIQSNRQPQPARKPITSSNKQEILHENKSPRVLNDVNQSAVDYDDDGDISANTAKVVAHKKADSSKKSSSLFTKLPNIKPCNVQMTKKSDYSPSNAPTVDSFDSMHLSPFILTSLKSSSFSIRNPTEIQKRVIPYILNIGNEAAAYPSNDIIVQAQTGSGKTLAYLIPILQDLISLAVGDRQKAGTMCLILLPTRELCQQVYDTIYSLLYCSKPVKNENLDEPILSTPTNTSGQCIYRWIVPGVLSGGQSKKSEKARLRKGITVLIATPGRLIDHLRSTQALNLRNLRWIVVDEADRFEEMGMKDALKDIWTELEKFSLESSRVKWQKIICSATVRANITELGGIQLKNPVFLSVSSNSKQQRKLKNTEEIEGNSDIKDFIPNQVETRFLTVPAKLRLAILVSLLRILYNKHKKQNKTIIFFSNYATVEFYHHLFSSCCDLITGSETDKISIKKLHGSISHQERMQTLRSFKSGLLLTTDLAARGLDFPAITEIIQYDIPNDKLACVHRIGRTGRCGNEGKAYIFVMPHEHEWIQYVNDQVSISGPIETYEKVIEELNGILKLKDVRLELSKWQRRFEETASKSHKLARDAYMASVRAYGTHPKEVRKCLGIKKLHLGHYAKSFALREAPSKLLSKTAVKKRKKEKVETNSDNVDRVKRMKIGSSNIMKNISSEFAA